VFNQQTFYSITCTALSATIMSQGQMCHWLTASTYPGLHTEESFLRS